MPTEISCPTKFLLLRGADVTAKLVGTAYRHSLRNFKSSLNQCFVTVVLTGNIHGNVLMKRYEEMVTALYREPEKEIKVGSFIKDVVDEADAMLFPRLRKTKLKEHGTVSGRNCDIRSLMVSNRHLPQTEEIPPKVVILDE